MTNSTREPEGATTGLLPAGLSLGLAELNVSDLGRSVDFYEGVVGLTTLNRGAGSASLGGAGGRTVIRLTERPGAAPASPRAAGLFHVAILLPERRDLAGALARLIRAQALSGASDHLVSEALYLDDPDGNGLEIYRDRPRAEWPYEAGRLRMATNPIDGPSLLALGGDPDAPMPAGTRVGHVHLKVGDLDAARAFWLDAMGFALTTSYPGAAFMSAGDYHHHVAANVWSSRGAGPAPEGAAGTVAFEILLPTRDDVALAGERLSRAGVRTGRREDGALSATDPWGTRAALRETSP